jgi:predicted GNAT superfamily acetyltransferase
MTPVKRRKRKDEIKVAVGPFRNHSDYKACVDIQREVWNFDDLDIVPTAMLLAAEHCGGLNLGAYNNLGEMVGFVCSIFGRENGELVHHSHMLAVRFAYRNFDIGFKLKVGQRKEALRAKVKTITWTFDPMQPLNAFFNFGKLGAMSNVYEQDFYGESSSLLHRGLPTDRFVACWHLADDKVADRLNEGPPRHELRKELKKHPVINTLEDVAPGMTSSSPIQLNHTERELLFEVPYNLPEIKNRNLGVALEWQGKMRQVFRHYFKKDYAATDFWVAEDDGHLRAFYFLEKRSK